MSVRYNDAMPILEALLVTLLLGLGTARMAAIISIDEISAPLRDLIWHRFPPEDSDEAGHYYQSFRKATPDERKRMASWKVPWWQKRWSPNGPVRRATFLGKLISCHRCTSVWIAAGNVALFYVWRDAAIVLNLVTAISFVSSAVDSRYYK